MEKKNVILRNFVITCHDSVIYYIQHLIRKIVVGQSTARRLREIRGALKEILKNPSSCGNYPFLTCFFDFLNWFMDKYQAESDETTYLAVVQFFSYIFIQPKSNHIDTERCNLFEDFEKKGCKVSVYGEMIELPKLIKPDNDTTNENLIFLLHEFFDFLTSVYDIDDEKSNLLKEDLKLDNKKFTPFSQILEATQMRQINLEEIITRYLNFFYSKMRHLYLLSMNAELAETSFKHLQKEMDQSTVRTTQRLPRTSAATQRTTRAMKRPLDDEYKIEILGPNIAVEKQLEAFELFKKAIDQLSKTLLNENQK